MAWLPILRRTGEFPLRSLRDEMDRLLSSFTEDWPVSGVSRTETGAWYPAVNIEETDREYQVKAELPGIESSEVEISVDDNVLCIKGEKKDEKEEKEKNYHRTEIHYGSFQRTFQLPQNVDAEKIKAESSKGILTVHIPKSPETKPKKIEIKTA